MVGASTPSETEVAARRTAPVSREVTLFLEALRDGRSGYWVHRSPLGVRAPSGSFVCLVSNRPLASPVRPLPRTWALLQRPFREPPLLTGALRLPATDRRSLARPTCPRLLPWTSLPVQRSRKSESDSRPDIPSPAPSPLGVSHALRGFILTQPCHHFQVADAHRVSPSELSSSQDRAGARRARSPSSTFPDRRCRTGCPTLLSPAAASPRGFGSREAVPHLPAR
jgi:hypothetical protein